MAAQLDSSEWRDELRATLGARGELGQEMEDEVIESFLGRLRGSIDKQVEAGVAEAMSHRRRGGISLGGVAVVLCLSIPLLAIAGGVGGAWGIVAVVALILVVLFKT